MASHPPPLSKEASALTLPAASLRPQKARYSPSPADCPPKGPLLPLGLDAPLEKPPMGPRLLSRKGLPAPQICPPAPIRGHSQGALPFRLILIGVFLDQHSGEDPRKSEALCPFWNSNSFAF